MSESTPRGSQRGARRVRGRPSLRTGAFEVFAYPHHRAPVLVFGAVWRWRVEILTMITIVVVWVALAYPVQGWLDPEGHWPGWIIPVVLITIVIVVFVVPVSRRFVMCRVWCVISRHRVRKCFVQSRVMTHEGLLPLFIWTRPTPVGERLRLWLRPGLSVRDIEKVTDRIAAACWARDARVTVSPKRVSTVWVEVIRRDPLAGTGMIGSPLLDGVQASQVEADAEWVPLPDRSTITPAPPVEGAAPGDGFPIPEAGPAMRGRTTRRTGTRTAPPVESESAAGVVGWSGKDVTDYV